MFKNNMTADDKKDAGPQSQGRRNFLDIVTRGAVTATAAYTLGELGRAFIPGKTSEAAGSTALPEKSQEEVLKQEAAHKAALGKALAFFDDMASRKMPGYSQDRKQIIKEMLEAYKLYTETLGRDKATRLVVDDNYRTEQVAHRVIIEYEMAYRQAMSNTVQQADSGTSFTRFADRSANGSAIAAKH